MTLSALYCRVVPELHHSPSSTSSLESLTKASTVFRNSRSVPVTSQASLLCELRADVLACGTYLIQCSPHAAHISAKRFSAVVVLDGQHRVGDAVRQAAIRVAPPPPGDEQAVEHDLDQMAAATEGPVSRLSHDAIAPAS